MNDSELKALQHALGVIAHRAGQAIMAIYANPVHINVTTKADHSPVTRADMEAHAIIQTSLAQLTPHIPVLSEESAPPSVADRQAWHRYWLVDPLDGTRDFIRRNGEFTVNIALIENGEPVLSVVEAPAFNEAFSARQHAPAMAYTPVQNGNGFHFQQCQDIHCNPWQPGRELRILESRSHGRGVPQQLLARLPPHYISPLGSSLKLCRIATGAADLYLRSGPTSEWDTAAAQFILERAGGAVVDMQSGVAGQRLRYNQRDSLINPSFLACAPGVVELFQDC